MDWMLNKSVRKRQGPGVLYGGTAALVPGAPLWPTGLWDLLASQVPMHPVPHHSILLTPLTPYFLSLPSCSRCRRWVLGETLWSSSHLSTSTQAALNSCPPLLGSCSGLFWAGICIFPWCGTVTLPYLTWK